MKLTKVLVLTILFASMMALPTFAAKPETNNAGAKKVNWNLSGAVMPVPPYGSVDIVGSDTASKLIVNQPNGKTQVVITGVMNGLTPDTTYMVFVSNGYTPYKYVGWDVSGDWVLSAVGTYNHDYDLTMSVSPYGTITGTGGYPSGGSYSIHETITGTVIGTTVTLHGTYDGSAYSFNATLTIQPDGTLVGTFKDSSNYIGSFVSTSGQAVERHTGDLGWTGLSTNIQPITFTTDEFGSGSWHVNINATNLTTSVQQMSIWINNGGTMLISDPFSVAIQ